MDTEDTVSAQAKSWSMHTSSRALANEEDALNVPGTPGATIYATCESLLRELNTEGTKLAEARQVVHQATVGNGNESPLRSGEAHDLALASQKLNARIMATSTAAANRVKDATVLLEKQVADSFELGYVRTPEGISVAGMVSDHVAGLNDADRLDFLTERATAGDKRTLAAVLSLPSYLSGLSDKEHALVRRIAAEKFAPVAFRQLEAASMVRQRMEWATNEFMSLYAEVQKGFDPKRADAKRRAAMIGGVA